MNDDIMAAAYGEPVAAPALYQDGRAGGRTERRHAGRTGGAREPEAGGATTASASGRMRLNAAQRAAVEADDGKPLLIVAGPGSGKTHVLIARMSRLLRENRARPSGLLACTFTNRAAVELRGRLEREAGKAAARIAQVSTLHTAAARLLREVGRRTGYIGEFEIADQRERGRRLRDVLFDCRIDTSTLSPRDVGRRISYAKNMLRDTTDPHTYSDDPDETERDIAKAAAAYRDNLLEAGLLDFDDLLLRALHMLDTRADALQQCRDMFTHVIVDEYQDTNEPQYRIVRHLCAEHRRITVVGDPDQAIYGWRGADNRKILQFRSDYPDAAEVRLERNYRSSPQICGAATALIRHATERLEHDVIAADDTPGRRVEWNWFARQADEAAHVIEEFRKHLDRRPLETRAALYRTNAQARAFETGLRRARIPYRIIGGVGFFARPEVLDALAYLRVIDNPADDEALRRIVNLPRRHLGRQTMQIVEEYRDRQHRARARTSTYDCFTPVIDKRLVKRWQVDAMSEFVRLIERLQRMRSRPVCEVIEHSLDDTGYFRMVSQMDDEVAEDKRNNLNELIEDARQWEAELETEPDGQSRLRAYVERCDDLAHQQDEEDSSATTFLMTLHAAKGQEFEIVALAGVEEEILPHKRAMEDRPGGLAEERRLCYVGMTRAKRILMLSGCEWRPGRDGGQRQMVPSRFIDDLDKAGVLGK